jgi:hypothetical protein
VGVGLVPGDPLLLLLLLLLQAAEMLTIATMTNKSKRDRDVIVLT